MANILCQAARLLGYETKHPEKERDEKDKEGCEGEKGLSLSQSERDVNYANILSLSSK